MGGISMAFYVDENIKNTERVFSMPDRYQYKRFDMNENPYGLPDDFIKSVLNDITPNFISIYPEPWSFCDKYANYIGVKPENITVTNGSDAAIRYILQTFCKKGHDVLTVSPSFEMYGVNCSILGLNHVPVFYDENLQLNTRKIVSSINSSTDIVVLVNPNNPIGDVYNRSDVQEIIDRAKEFDALVVIDEAYHYFYDETYIDKAISEPNVIVLRTFSKLFSIAACRLGVVVSNPQIINYINNLKLSFDVNSFALLFGTRLLENQDIVDKLISDEKAGRALIVNKFRNAGYKVKDSNGNFIFIEPKSTPLELAERLKNEKKILVKVWKNGPLAKYVRISTGAPVYMQELFDAFTELDNPHSA